MAVKHDPTNSFWQQSVLGTEIRKGFRYSIIFLRYIMSDMTFMLSDMAILSDIPQSGM